MFNFYNINFKYFFHTMKYIYIQTNNISIDEYSTNKNILLNIYHIILYIDK